MRSEMILMKSAMKSLVQDRNIVSSLDGVSVSSKSHVGGIMIKDELERLWNDNIIVKKVKDLKG